MIFKNILFFIISLFLVSCTSGIKYENLDMRPDKKKTTKKSDVVILGGSIVGLTAASKISDFDQSINISLVEKSEDIVTEPLLNMYIAQKIDKSMVTDAYEDISEKHGFEMIKEDALSIDTENKKLYFNKFVLEYEILVDARYKAVDCNKMDRFFICNDYKEIDDIRKKLSLEQKQKVLIDTSNLEDNEIYRAYELFALLNNSKKDLDIYIYLKEKDDTKIIREIQIEKNSIIKEIESLSKFDIVLAYPEYKIKETGWVKYTENFFKQYNEGQYIAAEIIKKLNNGIFLPNIVKEDTIVIVDVQKLEGIDVYSFEKVDITEILAKIKKIKLEIM